MHASDAVKVSSGTYTPNYVKKVLRFTANRRNKARYKKFASKEAILAQIEARARLRVYELPLGDLWGTQWAFGPWSTIIERSAWRILKPLGYRIVLKKYISRHNDIGQFPTIVWGG